MNETETAQHTRTKGDDPYCEECAVSWPCTSVLLAQRDALLEALKGTAFWHLTADGSLCWCRLDDLEPDDERHLPGCKAARAAIATAEES